MDLWAEAAPCLKDVVFLPSCTRGFEGARGYPQRPLAVAAVIEALLPIEGFPEARGW